MTIILLSLLGVVISVIIGTCWYSMKTPMGKIHMASMGFDKLSAEEQKKQMELAKPTMWKSYVSQMILSFLTSFFIVFIMFKASAEGESMNSIVGYLVLTWLCFMVPIIGSAQIWGGCQDKKLGWKKFISDSLANLVTILIVALVTSWFV